MMFMEFYFSGSRLSMIQIGTTDVSPEVEAPTLHYIHVCASQDSGVPGGETQAFPCSETGRYLVVLLEKTEVVLTLCEVEVFEPCTVYESTKGVLPFYLHLVGGYEVWMIKN